MESVLRKLYYGVMDGTRPYPRNEEHRRQTPSAPCGAPPSKREAISPL